MIRNPEFTKNLWLEFSWHKIGLGLISAIVILYCAYLSGNDILSRIDALSVTSLTMCVLILGLWGTKKAADSIYVELKEKTWDFIKVSSISPLKLMLGKVFGATSYNWFLGFVCIIAAYCSTNFENGLKYYENEFFIFCIMLSIFCHFAAYLFAVKSITTKEIVRSDSLIVTIIILILSGSLFGAFMQLDNRYIYVNPDDLWYGMSTNSVKYYLLMISIILFWTILGAWNLTRSQLGYKVSNIYWLLFTIYSCFHAFGYFVNDKYENEFSVVWIIYFVGVLFFYTSIFLEKKDRVALNKIFEQYKNGRYFGLDYSVSSWVISFAFLLFLSAAYLAIFPQLFSIVFYTLALVLRDSLILIYFGLSGSRKKQYLGVVYVILLYSLAPYFITALTGDDNLQALFNPIFSSDQNFSNYYTLSPILQFLLAFLLTRKTIFQTSKD